MAALCIERRVQGGARRCILPLCWLCIEAMLLARVRNLKCEHPLIDSAEIIEPKSTYELQRQITGIQLSQLLAINVGINKKGKRLC